MLHVGFVIYMHAALLSPQLTWMNANDNMMDTHYQQQGRMHTGPGPFLWYQTQCKMFQALMYRYSNFASACRQAL